VETRWVSVIKINIKTNTLIEELVDSTPLVSKPITKYDSKPVPSTSHPHNLLP
jgi:hypothetical protein